MNQIYFIETVEGQPMFRGTTDGTKAAALFHSRESAEEYLIFRGFSSEWRVNGLGGAEMTAWLERAIEQGVTWVAWDPPADATDADRQVVPIDLTKFFQERLP
jgi:hypothetical protein